LGQNAYKETVDDGRCIDVGGKKYIKGTKTKSWFGFLVSQQSN